jgi:hypothetical protein
MSTLVCLQGYIALCINTFSKSAFSVANLAA